MIKALKEQGPNGAPLVLLGLSHENLDRLREGQPIHLDIDQCAALGMGQRELLIMAGTDEAAIAADLESHGLLPEGAAEKAREAMERRPGT